MKELKTINVGYSQNAYAKDIIKEMIEGGWGIDKCIKNDQCETLVTFYRYKEEDLKQAPKSIMREVKAKAWDTVEKYMTIPRDIKGWMDAFAQAEWDMKNKGNYLVKNWIFLQYTGHKDKNGKEIYDGDILKFFDKIVAKVVYQEFGGWSFEWTDPRYKVIRQQNPEPFFRNINLFEVVGNIYENPDLL